MQQEAAVLTNGSSIMKLLVILALALSCQAQLSVPFYGAQEYRMEDGFGNQGFGYFDYNLNHQQTRTRDGNVVGRYSYIDPAGKPVITFYNAGREGFKVTSTNLPVGPNPVETPQYQGPKPVEETPEVAEVRRKMADLHDEAAGRTKRQATITTYPLGSTGINNVLLPRPLLYPFVNPHSSVMPYYYLSTLPNEKDTKTVEISRQRRDADPLVPLVYNVPSVVKAKVETKQLVPAEGRTPADTTQLKMTTVQQEVPVATFPTYGYTHVGARPMIYAANNPTLMPYYSLY